MPETTRHLALPLIAAGQAQKHVTHNEALGLLDALVQLACLDKDRAAPPANPAEGDRYLVAAREPGGAWAGLSGQVVRFADGVWAGTVPRPGWLAYVIDEADLYLFDGRGWLSFRASLKAFHNLVGLGIGTEADARNPFAAKLNAALWTARTRAEGGSGDLRVSLNKPEAGNVLSLLMQTGFSGRAEIGLSGEDALAARVSADGLAWTEAWRVDPATGFVGFGTAAAPGAGPAGAPVAAGTGGGGPLVALDALQGAGAGAAPGAAILARVGRGAPGAPAPVRAGDRFFALLGRGFHAGGAYSGDAVSLQGLAEEDFSAAAQGTALDIQTTDLGGTARRSVLKVRGNGALELQPRAGVPARGLGAGQIVFDSTAAAFRGYDGTRWLRLTNLVRFAAATNFDNYLPADTWTRVQFNIGEVNEQGAFAASGSRFVAPEAGTYRLGASLAYRRNGSAAPSALQVRFHRNGTAAGRGRGAATGLVDGVSVACAGALLALQAGDAVEVFARLTGADGYVAAADTDFWGHALA
ncbi:DUF2793 domain-containing protein [Methylobacterium planeticum]|uniref:DUF2793 domain-containing protein n=1 Tax=Methylobacterium planeticum TaxID=2615211 RepID=A0A6N6MQD0_9HYPH|nr:DUF2793 domain-containing protein [Methylobacterium planeticum]KAB1072835.1 DUF2793 domain-containing protein [Methylobacterium planeticum]